MKKFSSTMKASSRRTLRNKRVFKIIIATVILVIAIFLIPKLLGKVAALVLSPIAGVERWIYESTGTIPSFFRERNALLADVIKRDKQLAGQSGATLTIRRLEIENEILRGLLGSSSTERIAAGVVVRPPSTPFDRLILDQGSNNGVIEGAPVFTGRDQVIGYVEKVFSGSSVVTLVTSPGIESTVFIIGPNIYTTAVGQGGGVLQVGVPQGIPLALGNLVVIPSFDAGVYGSIVSIDSIETRPEQYGFVTSDVSIQSLRWVSIGRTSLSEKSFTEAKAIIDRVRSDLLTVPVPEGVLVEISTATSSPTTTPSL